VSLNDAARFELMVLRNVASEIRDSRP